MSGPRRIRWAVAGLGHIAQEAVLPAFAGARERAELAALISGDAEKRRVLSGRYGVRHAGSYPDLERVLREAGVEALYLAVPNPQHRELTERALRAGVNVLCEKPIAVTPEDAESMLRAARETGLRLGVAYRLHFEPANLDVLKELKTGRIGDPRVFSSTFTMSVAEGNIRLRRDGGGVLFDIGIYCINAARGVFGGEPVEACALSTTTGEPRFRETDETLGAVLRFPGGGLASIAVSFGAAPVSQYRIVGTKGDLVLEPAYDWGNPLRRRLTVRGRSSERVYRRTDQFAAELIRFSDAVREGTNAEPAAEEGLADLRVMAAVRRSIQEGRGVPVEAERRPMRRPPPRRAMRVEPPLKPKPLKAPPPRAG